MRETPILILLISLKRSYVQTCKKKKNNNNHQTIVNSHNDLRYLDDTHGTGVRQTMARDTCDRKQLTCWSEGGRRLADVLSSGEGLAPPPSQHLLFLISVDPLAASYLPWMKNHLVRCPRRQDSSGHAGSA